MKANKGTELGNLKEANKHWMESTERAAFMAARKKTVV